MRHRGVVETWVKRFIDHDNVLSVKELEFLADQMYKDLGIKRFGYSKCYNVTTLAKEIIRRHPDKIRRCSL